MKRIMLVGGGHRAAFYLRIARLMPETFEVGCAFVRDPKKAEQFERTWGVKAYARFEEMLDAERADFAIVAVFPEFAPEYIRKLARANVPVLCETPPALTLEGLVELNELVRAGARIQVAEQYNFVPLHAARLNALQSGVIGRVSHAQVSVAHDYHGLSLMRHLLGVKFENACVSACSVKGALLDGPTRYNTYVPDGAWTLATEQTLALFDYGDRSGLYDFMGEQYGSWVRRQRVLVRGERGEIADDTVRALLDERTPVVMPLTRMDTHEYDYMYLHGYTLGEKWVYRNRYLPSLRKDALSTYYGRAWDFESTNSRLTDDEIAVADVLNGMTDYLDTGRPVYDFAEGAQDQYMRLVIDEALLTGQRVMMRTQPWAQ